MKHIQGFNEEFNWNKLNIFSSKKKEELKKKEEINEDDEALAKAIYSEINGKVEGDKIKGDGYTTEFRYEYDGDKIASIPSVIRVNNQKLDCSKETSKKFFVLFKSKQEESKELEKKKRGEDKKTIKDKLKSKYKK